MIIIKPGKLPAEREHLLGSCTKCGCVFTAEKSEAVRTTTQTVTFVCPTRDCGAHVEVPRK